MAIDFALIADANYLAVAFTQAGNYLLTMWLLVILEEVTRRKI